MTQKDKHKDKKLIEDRNEYGDDFIMSPKNDFVFKLLFGDSKNNELLKNHYYVYSIRNLEDWVNEIDENSLEYINKSFILPDFIEKEADVVYKLKLKGKNVILYCLLELQSTVDYSMPIKMEDEGHGQEILHGQRKTGVCGKDLRQKIENRNKDGCVANAKNSSHL